MAERGSLPAGTGSPGASGDVLAEWLASGSWHPFPSASFAKGDCSPRRLPPELNLEPIARDSTWLQQSEAALRTPEPLPTTHSGSWDDWLACHLQERLSLGSPAFVHFLWLKGFVERKSAKETVCGLLRALHSN